MANIENIDFGSAPNAGSQDGKNFVMLPCEAKDFSKFIAGLLGKPQETTGRSEGIFRVTNVEVANIFHLVNQRMAKQNDSTLIHFAITVHYSDGTSVTHNTVAAFENYHPIVNSYPIAISVNFNYLIKFNGRDIPEKQEITVVISTDPDFGIEGRFHWFQSGLFLYKISHTEITWATDIAGLLKNHAENIISKSSKLKTFIFRNADELLSFWFTTIFVVIMVFWGLSANSIYASNAITSISGAVRYLSVSMAIFLSLGAVLYSIHHFYEMKFHLRSPSFIILTNKDTEHVTKIEKNNTVLWIGYILGWVLGLASGVLSNYLYSIFSK
ncbi:MAG: hypothetical protein ABFE02_08960 [Sulfuricella sp.]